MQRWCGVKTRPSGQRWLYLALQLMVCALICVPVRADLASAETAYKKGDFSKASQDYRELAELGQPLAQLNLAIMYTRGEGVRQSDINAYAWATLAAEGGEARGQALADQLRSYLAPGSEKIAADIAAPYRRAELDARLMPKMEEDPPNGGGCRFLAYPTIEYPKDAMSRGVSGNVLAEFAVMPDGRARRPRIVYAVPVGVFESTVRRAVLHITFATRSADASPAHCKLMVRFVTPGALYPRLEAFVSKTRTDAEAGDVGAEFLYGMMLAGFPQLKHSMKDALPWFLKAAQSGAPGAQYEVGESLMLGMGCQCETNKGELWLRKAAEADQADAQVTIAQYALRGTADEANSRIAKTWLERAVKSGSHDGMLYLAALLAANPLSELRDPTRALGLLDKVGKEMGGDPTEYEIRAAAQAALGQFGTAVASERKALSIAKSLDWNLGPLQDRLGRYQSDQPWYGNLLAL